MTEAIPCPECEIPGHSAGVRGQTRDAQSLPKGTVCRLVVLLVAQVIPAGQDGHSIHRADLGARRDR